MHSDPQISLHLIALPFNSSRDAKSQRLCRVKLGGDFSPVSSSSTRLCTDQFIRLHLPDKTQPSTRDQLAITLDKPRFSLQKAP
jgi:hypothetical protein